MPTKNVNIEALRLILENSLTPQVLDSHPWTKSLVVAETVREERELKHRTPGQQLVIAVTKLFTENMPEIPPQHGNKTDERWGRFGILAAQYFTPLVFGTSAPDSREEMLKAVDESILLFRFGETDGISKATRDTYRLNVNEADLTDGVLEEWLNKGIEELAENIAEREHALSRSLKEPSVIHRSRHGRTRPLEKKRRRTFSPTQIYTIAAAVIAVLILIASGVYKANKIYTLAGAVQKDAAYAKKIISESEMRLGRLKNLGGAVSTLRKDFAALEKEAKPFFWMGPLVGRLTPRGADLASIENLSGLAGSLLDASDTMYQVFAPLVEEGDLSTVNPVELSAFLNENQLQISSARESLKKAEAARARLNVASLSPDTRELILNNIDPLMKYLRDGLAVATQLPNLMGAGKDGSKTYLLLVQNEDELRPTGGFITAASTIRVKDGDLGDLKFVNSGDLDNWYKLYPAAPWQLREYMNSPVLVFRDANWFTNFPTTAVYAKYLYSYSDNASVDGVIAFNQKLLIDLLQATGPLQVEGETRPVDSINIVEYMRESKTPDRTEAYSSDWNNKAFLNKISYALIEKIFSGDVQWELISAALLKALNERSLILQVDNAEITTLLALYHWDGSVQSGGGDFLMAVDSNIGFNKTNAVIESTLSYDVDLTNLSAPNASLIVLHKNKASKSVICKQWLKNRLKEEEGYPITDCYWNYLRIYKPVGTVLASAMPQVVPDLWMINQQKNPGRVDILEEEINGVAAFGTLEVVPAGETLPVSFQFILPAHVLNTDDGQVTYKLKVQKQPGTQAIPLTIRVHLPNRAVTQFVSPGAVTQGGSVLYETDLETDREFIIVFFIP